MEAVDASFPPRGGGWPQGPVPPRRKGIVRKPDVHDRIERSMSVETAAGPFAGDGWITHRLRDGTDRHLASAPGSTGIPPGLSLGSTDRRIVPPFDGETLPSIGICL